MHKKSKSKQRYIAASYACTTKEISAVLTKCLKLIEKQHRIIGRQYEKNYGINPMWILHNSASVHQSFANFNLKKDAKDIRTYDFTTLYTSIPHSFARNFVGLSKKRSIAPNILSSVFTNTRLAGRIHQAKTLNTWTVTR